MSAIFPATAWNYSAKFLHTYYLFIQYLHAQAKRRLIFCCYCKVTDFFCEMTSWFRRFESLVL